jgi:general secretion pathway protein D
VPKPLFQNCLRPIIPCVGLGLIGILALTWAATAAPRSTGNPFRKTPSAATTGYGSTYEPAEHEPVAAEPATRIKMNYMRASWQKVLQDLAEATQTQLVCDKFPKKPYSRFDRRAYSPDEALRIINNEIEPQGFRAMFKGSFLVVIDLPSARTEYPRAVIPAGGAKPAEAGGDSIEQAGGAALEIPAPKPRTTTTPIRTRTQAARAETRGTDQVAWQLEEKKPNPASTEPPQATQDAAEEPVTQTSIRLRKRDAVSVSRIIYRAFKAQSELIEQGPGGFQGFRVFAATDADGKASTARPGAVRFSVGIDDERNVLIVEAGAREMRAVSNLIYSLDTLPTLQQPMVRAVTTTKDAGHLAAALQPELDRLSTESRNLDRRNRRGYDDELADAGDPQEQTQQPPVGRAPPRTNIPPEAMPQPGGQPNLQSIVGALKSDVTVEAVPDLGVVILRGNQADVDQVMEIIRQIEQLSAGTAPDVELVMLRHVNSESLATLLTQLYDRLSGGGGRPRTGQASSASVGVIPVVRPNAVLVVAGQADMEKVISLIDNLDRPGEPTAEFRVFRLKYAVPDQVVSAITALYPAPTAQGGQQTAAGLTPIVRAYADVRTNAIIVQARPADMAEVAQLILDMDIDESSSVNALRIFTLQNAMADELAVTLQLAIQSVLTPARVNTTGQGGQLGAGAGAQGAAGAGTMTELRDVRSTILELIGPDGRDKTIRSGILADIRVSADARTNSLVVTAPPQSMELMAALIKQLDTPAAAVAEIKVFTLQNGDAQATASLLQTLFTGQQQGGQGGRGQLGQNQNQAIGFQIAGEDATSTLIPVRFSVDVRTNSIIGIGGAEALRVAEAIIYRLDESDVRQRQNAVYRLKNAPALDVASAIAQFLQTQQQVITQDPAFLSPFEQFEREVVVVPEIVNNSLLISATPRFFKDIMDLIKELDSPPKQVIIQALLVEVTLDNTDEWGVELGIQDSILFSRSLVEQAPITVAQTNTSPNGVQTTTQTIIGQTAIPGFNFNNQPLGNNTQANLNTGRIGPQGLSNFSLGRINGDLGYGGLVLSAGSEAVSVLLRALAARRRVDVLSRPQIRTLDNQLAQIQVGQEIRVTQSVNTNQQTGFSTPNVQARQIGIILSVTPRINNEGVVVMEVAARKDSLNPRGIPLIANPNGTTIDSPVIDTTNALTTVSVRTGQTVVIGGMITKSDDNSSRKVPILGDIPYLGALFRYDSQKVRRTELLIFLTPRVIQSDEEAEMIKQIEIERMNFIEEEAVEMHGPLFGAPGEADWIRPGAAAGEMYYQPQNSNQRPMPMDDPNVPTTIMQGEPNQVPPMPQDNGLQWQGQRSTRRETEIVQAGYQEESPEPSRPRQLPSTAGSRGSNGKEAQAPRGASPGPVLNSKPLKRASASKTTK